jgi:hypothetical protein
MPRERTVRLSEGQLRRERAPVRIRLDQRQKNWRASTIAQAVDPPPKNRPLASPTFASDATSKSLEVQDLHRSTSPLSSAPRVRPRIPPVPGRSHLKGSLSNRRHKSLAGRRLHRSDLHRSAQRSPPQLRPLSAAGEELGLATGGVF